RMRIKVAAVIREAVASDAERLDRTLIALHQIMDIDLAIMLETYREDLEAKNRASERLATIGQFAAGIGHELRNPLGVIESSLFLLRRHMGPDVAAIPGVAKHVDRISGEIARANKTIEDLLSLARSRPPRRRRTEVRRLVDAAIHA